MQHSVRVHPVHPLGEADTHAVALIDDAPWIRGLGKLTLEVRTEGWRFPQPPVERQPRPATLRLHPAEPKPTKRTRLKPPADILAFKDRLLCLLQPPLEQLFGDRRIDLPFRPFPYQMDGIAFLMPRHGALLADEMGLGKTMQAIVAIRLMLHAGLLRDALIVCPKPLVPNWSRELRMWAGDIPVEVIGGDSEARHCGWLISNSPIKLVNYELLGRDADLVEQAGKVFDLVVLDEAQRIKNRESKTAQAARGLRRERSWALTGTPIENRPDDLISLFAFVQPGHVPADTPTKRLPQLTRESVLRRSKEDVLPDLPPRIIRDAFVELTPGQRAAYQLAEDEGVVRLNALGDTITVQHVFELLLRLKQICNFDPLTGESAKLDQLRADLDELADSGRKAILFSQWVEPLEILARELHGFGPLLFHGRVSAWQRQEVLHAFRTDPTRRVLLMSYGTGSVGLNLQFANYVFLFDRWWNPAVEDQAINRAHRIGQREPVFVTRFIAQDTIEGRICEVLERKRQLFAELIDAQSPPSLGLNEDEIFSLFDLRVRPKRQLAA
jgi:SNF2 family DNA or RNA helicase